MGGGVVLFSHLQNFKNSPWYLTYSPANDERKIS